MAASGTRKTEMTGVLKHSTIDTEAHWSKSGYHGWWYGWKLHLTVLHGDGALDSAGGAPDRSQRGRQHLGTLAMLQRLAPHEVRYILGDTLYNEPEVRPESVKSRSAS